MKKRIITLITVVALVSLSALAFAGPRGGRGAYANQLTTENRAAIQKIIESHQDKLYELREKIWAKHAELQALSASGKAEKSDIQSLIGDIAKLRDAMNQERKTISAEIEKQTGLKGFGPGGYHRGGMGMGYGMNDGSCPGGGYGKGFGRGMGGACVGGNCN